VNADVAKLRSSGEFYGLVLAKHMPNTIASLRKTDPNVSEKMERLRLLAGLEDCRSNGWPLLGLAFEKAHYQNFFQGALERFATPEEMVQIQNLRIRRRLAGMQ
jgi:hypothetical protein